MPVIGNIIPRAPTSPRPDVFAAIAEPRRRQIIDLLAAAAAWRPGAHRHGVDCDKQAVSKHLGSAEGVSASSSVSKQGHAAYEPTLDQLAARLRLGQDVRTSLGSPTRPHPSRVPSGAPSLSQTLPSNQLCKKGTSRQLPVQSLRTNRNRQKSKKQSTSRLDQRYAFEAMLDEIGPDANDGRHANAFH